MNVAAYADLFQLPFIGAEALRCPAHGVVRGVVVVQDIIRVGAKLRRKVLGGHGAVGGVPITVQPCPVAGERLAFGGFLSADLRSRRLRGGSRCRGL